MIKKKFAKKIFKKFNLKNLHLIKKRVLQIKKSFKMFTILQKFKKYELLKIVFE